MIEAMNLLTAVLDHEGWICIAGKRPNAAPIQKFFAPGQFADAISAAVEFDQQGLDAYFCTSTLLDATSRKASNVHRVRCLKLDLDIEPGNPEKHQSLEEAVIAVGQLCEKHGLALPVMVRSGGGLHCYWILDTSLSPADGIKWGEKLKAVAMHSGLKQDPTCTADIVRILRVPGTRNYKPERVTAKGNHPKVRVLPEQVLAPIDFELFSQLLDAAYAGVPNTASLPPEYSLFDGVVGIPSHIRTDKLDDSTRRLLGGKPKKMAIILAKSAAEKGCAQLHDIATNQDKQDEPRWRAGLSIAINCEDGNEAIHELSNRHPGYSYDDTIRKAALVNGMPYTCRKFQSDWPKLCDGCKFREGKDKITSPIQLGEYTAVAKATDNIVIAKNHEMDEEDRTYLIPEYPFPYKRKQGGGVILVPDDETEDAVEICKYDLYAVQRLWGEEQGYMIQMEVHRHKDGVVPFTIPTSAVGSPDKLRDILCREQIMATEMVEIKRLRNYVTRWLESMEREKEADKVKEHFGWTEDNASFVIGATEFKPGTEGVWSPAAPNIQQYLPSFKAKGTLEAWAKTFDTYGRTGMEAYALSALAGFGAPLVALTPVAGAVLNLTSAQSGIGKSTTQLAQLSIWGEPEKLLLTGEDTMQVRFHRMGIYNSLPVCVDEATDATAEDVSKFFLAITQNRGRHRMNSSSNTERVNHTHWNTLTTMSANTNFTEVLQAKKATVEGQLMRLIEITIPTTHVMDKIEADRIFNNLKTNYGHAGRIFMRYVVDNKEAIAKRLDDERVRFDQDTGSSSPERFWVNTFVCIYVGGCIAHELGLHHIDMEKMRRYMMQVMAMRRKSVQFTKSTIASSGDALSEFINHHHTSIVTAFQKGRVEWQVPNPVTNREVFGRYEPEQELLYVLQSEFRKFCAERKLHLQTFLDDQEARGVYLPSIPFRRLGIGMQGPSPNSRVFTFRFKKPAPEEFPAASPPVDLKGDD